MLGAVCALGAGCLVELEPALSCGDAYVDRQAGEECDPRDPDQAFLAACPVRPGAGSGLCNPETCTLECPYCGDGILQPELGEQCDGSAFSELCPLAEGEFSCNTDCTINRSRCEGCGDGILDSDANEECERRVRCNTQADCELGSECSNGICVPSGLIPTKSCSEIRSMSGLGDYVSGVVSSGNCTSSCLFDRTDCGYCGNGRLDGAYMDLSSSGLFQKPAERCDGAMADPDTKLAYCRQLCTDTATILEIDCDAQCNDECTGFANVEFPEPIRETAGCCIKGGATCSPDPGALPCCWALENPDQADDACQVVSAPGGLGQTFACRSF